MSCRSPRRRRPRPPASPLRTTRAPRTRSTAASWPAAESRRFSAGEYRITGNPDNRIRMTWSVGDGSGSRASSRAPTCERIGARHQTTDGPSNHFKVDIQVPAKADLYVRLTAGELRLERVEGSKDVELHAGDLRIERQSRGGLSHRGRVGLGRARFTRPRSTSTRKGCSGRSTGRQRTVSAAREAQGRRAAVFDPRRPVAISARSAIRFHPRAGRQSARAGCRRWSRRAAPSRAVMTPARTSFSISPSKCCMPSSPPSRIASSSDLALRCRPSRCTRACASSTSGSRAPRCGRRSFFGISRCEMK